MASRRLLIVGVNYAPEHSGNGPYTTGLAEHFAAAGWDVTVLTGMPHYPAWRLDFAYRGRLTATERRNGVTIRRRALYVPPKQSAARRALYEASFLASALPVTRVDRPDAIVGIVPSLSGGILARLFAARFHAPYGLLFQDLMGPAAAQSGIAGGGAVARATRRAERWALARARAVAAVTEAFFPYLEGLGVSRDRLAHVPNWTHIASPAADREATRHELGWDDGRIAVLHAGNMGLKQDLGQVVEAARRAAASSSPIRFVLLGDGSQRADLERRAAGLPTLTFMDPVPDERFPDVLAAADVLLLSQRRSVRDMSLPSKLTSYVAAGRPIVAAVAPGGTTAKEVEGSGIGLVVAAGDPAALLDAIERLAAQPDLAARLIGAARDYAAARSDREQATPRLDAFVALITRPTPLREPTLSRGVA